MTTFFFVRHGVTAHTGHKLSGWLPDIHLTGEGMSQAEVIAASLSRVPFKAIYSSPIDRTLETAQVIAAPHGLQVRTRRSLGEVRHGKWTNRSFKSLRRTRLWSTVQRWPSGVRFPDGETFLDVCKRAVDEVERMRLEHPRQTLCVVSHADVIKLIAAHYLGMHIDHFQRLAIGPASVTVIAISNEGPRVMTVNAPPSASFAAS
ncbi:MAG: histidine phosphatase family protein [Actinomycetota bacterium]